LLCDAIQAVFGRTDAHLHHFEKHGEYWGVPDEADLEGLNDEGNVQVRKVRAGCGDSLNYAYDFEDNWRHKILLERVLPAGSTSRPIWVDGRRRRPPEDIGGPSGYEEFLNVTFEPGLEEAERFRKWAGATFHAEEFDLKAVNRVLAGMRWPVIRSR
jgi:hypothetical protein